MKSISVVDAQLFYSYFVGNQRFYGVTQELEEVSDKVQCKSFCVHESPQLNNYLTHLQGCKGIGVSPLLDDDTCFFGALDIDHFDGDLQSIVNAVVDYNLPLLPCQSKSKKLHLYIFFKEATSALDVIEILSWYRLALGLTIKTELFPKQSHILTSQYPSWINLPYFGNTRQALFPQLLTLEEALMRIKEITFTAKEHKTFLQSLYFYDAPPCIQAGILLRDMVQGRRNTWMFAFGVFLTFKELDLEQHISQINDQLSDPLSDQEIQSTISGLQKKTYFYPCKELNRCDKLKCRSQTYGINYKLASGLSYGQLTQYLVDPPYYEWEVNGQVLVFYSESELLSASRFRELCLRQLHLVPRPIPNDQWAAIVNKACANIIIKTVDVVEEDLSPGALFTSLVQSYFVSTRLTDQVSNIKYDRIVREQSGIVYFSSQSLFRFITDICGFKQFTASEIRRRLIYDFKASPPKPGEKLWKIDIEVKKVQSDTDDIKEIGEEDVNF